MYRLTRPRRLQTEMEKIFFMRKSKLSAVLDTFSRALYDLALPYLSNVSILHTRMAGYAAAVHRKCGLLRNIWGFIDGTIRRIQRPTYYQRRMYSGYKRMHGIKFQSITTPDGLIANLYGPMNGNRHDSFMLGQSAVLDQLKNLMPRHADGTDNIYALYGDPAYPRSIYLFGGFRNPPPGSAEARWNARMSSVRVSVEWGFAQILKRYPFLDYTRMMKIFEIPVARYYFIATFLTNIRSCFYGNPTSLFFDLPTMSFYEYINLVP